jgi:hypothetical protein
MWRCHNTAGLCEIPHDLLQTQEVFSVVLVGSLEARYQTTVGLSNDVKQEDVRIDEKKLWLHLLGIH